MNTPCEKHQWEFKGNKKFIAMHIGARGSKFQVSIRALHICKACGKESKRTPNPNFPMPKI